MSPPRIRVAIKYCGSCNPHINLVKIAAHLTETTRRENIELVPLAWKRVDILILLCGCPRACADRADIRAGARQTLLLAGEYFQGKLISEESVLSTIEERLIDLVKSLKKSKERGKSAVSP